VILGRAGLASAAAIVLGGAVAWAAALPESYRIALENAGHVRYTPYDPDARKSTDGLTVFDFRYADHYTYTFETEMVGDSIDVRIHPEIHAEVTLQHTISLPRNCREGTAWCMRLRSHELDHVAISTDERPRLIFRWLVEHLDPIEHKAAAGTRIGGDWVRKAIDAEVATRHQRVLALIQRNYDLLDSVSVHGLRPIADRRAFFEDLYSLETLRGMHWAEAAEIADLLESEEYRQARRWCAE